MSSTWSRYQVLNKCSLFFSSPVPLLGWQREAEASERQSSKTESTGMEKQLGSWSESKGCFWGGRDQRLNYADYSFVPCSLYLLWCLLGCEERQTHTICTRNTKASSENMHTNLDAREKPHQTHTNTHGHGHVCKMSSKHINMLRQSFRSSHAHKLCKCTTLRVRANTYMRPGTHMFTTVSPQ